MTSSPQDAAASTNSKHHHERPLAESIAVATRGVHAKLNKLIIARLPLALPPRAADPAVYVTGLLHITPIYMTFEELWQKIVKLSPQEHDEHSNRCCSPESSTSDAGHIPRPCCRIHAILQRLRLPELMRSDRLKADIGSMTGWSEHDVEEQLRMTARGGRLGDFVLHIQRAIENRPHVLLAYSYILYMALFAGGRFIRASLESAGCEFWEQLPSPIKPSHRPCAEIERTQQRASGLADEELSDHDYGTHRTHTMPLRFLHFKSQEDGEELKRDFKSFLADSEGVLTESEKDDIVQESVCIFDNMLLLVKQLDSVCATADDEDGVHSPLQGLAELLKNPLGTRLRDSVAVAKERSARSSRVSSSGDASEGAVAKRTRKPRYTVGNPHVEGAEVDLRKDSHGPMSNMVGVELCPALSKSMRFKKTLPRPTRGPEAAFEKGTKLSLVAAGPRKQLGGVQVVSWVMMAMVGAVALGALFSGLRRGELA